MLNYHWEKTTKLTQLPGEAEILRRLFEVLPQTTGQEGGILRNSLLKSAVYSTRIEVIPSTIQISRSGAQNLQEVYGQKYAG